MRKYLLAALLLGLLVSPVSGQDLPPDLRSKAETWKLKSENFLLRKKLIELDLELQLQALLAEKAALEALAPPGLTLNFETLQFSSATAPSPTPSPMPGPGSSSTSSLPPPSPKTSPSSVAPSMPPSNAAVPSKEQP